MTESVLSELRFAVMMERDVSEIMDLDSKILDKADKEIKRLIQKAREDPTPEEFERWAEEADSLKWSISDLFTYRLRKIHGLALTASVSPVDIPRKDLLPVEIETFEAVRAALYKYVGFFGIEYDEELGRVIHPTSEADSPCPICDCGGDE